MLNMLTIFFFYYTIGHLYWCDAFFDKIERSDLDGNNRQNISVYPGIHPFDLAVYKSDMYWTDWAVNTLLRMHISGVAPFGPDTLERASGLHIQGLKLSFLYYLMMRAGNGH